MNYIRTLLYIVLFLPFLFSCEMKKDLFGGEEKVDEESISIENAGLLDLEIKPEKEAPVPGTKVDIEDDLDSNDFAISILDSLGQIVKAYESYAALKEAGDLLLPAGLYEVKAYLGDNINAGFNAPYYAGDTTCEISAKEVAKVVAKCSLQNKKLQFEVTDQFKEEFQSDYTIVVDNGLGVLSISADESRIAYLKNTGTLRFTVYATTNANKVCTYSVDMSKDTVIQNHNNVYIKLDASTMNPDTPDGGDDNEGDGGDEPEEPEDPEEPEEPGDGDGGDKPDLPVKAPVLKVDITLIEKDYVIVVPSDFTESDKPDTGGDGDDSDNTGGDDNKPGDGGDDTAKPTIKGDGFDMDSPIQLTPSNAEGKEVRIKISTPGKLTSLQVTISSSTGVLEPLLTEMKLGTSFDMCNPTTDQKSALSGLGLALPKKGITSMVFDISSFMPLIAILDPGDYKFTIKATDEARQSVSKTLTVHLSK